MSNKNFLSKTHTNPQVVNNVGAPKLKTEVSQKRIFGGFAPSRRLKADTSIPEPGSEANAIELIDPDGRRHGVISITSMTGVLKKETENPSVVLHMLKEIGRGSEKQVFIGELIYKNDDGSTKKTKVAVTMQNLVKKQGLWRAPITVLTSLFKAPAKKEMMGEDSQLEPRAGDENPPVRQCNSGSAEN